MSTKAIIAGASGLIGSKLLNILLMKPDYDEILILVRKELPIEHKKLAQLVIDFEKLDEYADTWPCPFLLFRFDTEKHAGSCCISKDRP